MIEVFQKVWDEGSGGSAALLLAVGITFVCLLLFGGARLATSALFERLEKLAERSSARIRLQLHRLVSTLRFTTNVGLFLVIALFYVPMILRLFPPTRNLAHGWEELVRSHAWQAIEALVGYLPNLLFIVFLFIVGRILLGLLRQVYLSLETGQISWAGFEPEWAKPTFQIVRVAVILFGAILAFPYLPASDTEAFKAIGVAAGILLSFGSTGAVANATAGVALTYERAFRRGDYVSVNGHEGIIDRIGALTTRIRTLKNECVVLPNQLVLTTTVVNFSHFQEGVAIGASATIGYDIEWRRVHAILEDAARTFRERTEFKHADRGPRILQTALNDFHVGYSVEVFVCGLNDRRIAETILHECVRDAFDRGGVVIMSPAQNTLHFVGTPPKIGG